MEQDINEVHDHWKEAFAVQGSNGCWCIRIPQCPLTFWYDSERRAWQIAAAHARNTRQARQL